MKYLVCITLIAFLCAGISAQTSNRADEADAMRKVVETITAAQKKPKIDIVLRDLREINGKIIRVYDDSFVVEIKQPKKRSITVISIGTVPSNPKPLVTIKYRDVLQIEGKGGVLSFVPDPKKTPYSEWNAIPTVGVGTLLQVHTKDGEITNGVFTTWADDRITLTQNNSQTEIAKDDIVRIYQLVGDTATLVAKFVRRGRKGVEVADAALRVMLGVALYNPVQVAIGGVIAVQAVMHVLPKGGVKRVLVFAR